MIRYLKTNNIYRGALCAPSQSYPFLKGFSFFLDDIESKDWYSNYARTRCIILRIVGASRDIENSLNSRSDNIYSCCVNKRVMFFI